MQALRSHWGRAELTYSGLVFCFLFFFLAGARDGGSPHNPETRKDWLVLQIIGLKFSLVQWQAADAWNQVLKIQTCGT